MIEEPRKVQCCECNTTFPGSKWGAIRASEAGWFFGRDGVRYCPAHVPAWVEPWRAKQAKKVTP